MNKRQTRRILAIGAHPDDVEICCAGTLALHAKHGDDVHICVITDGSMGQGPEDMSGVSTLRRSESLAAADVIGAHLHWLGCSDTRCVDNHESRLLLTEVIRKINPDCIYGHWIQDQHPDHIAAAQLSGSASLLATIEKVKTSSAAVDRAAKFMIMEPILGAGFHPDIWVDISDAIDTKLAMLDKHVSQRELVSQGRGVSTAEIVRVMSRYRGLQAGVDFAEAFGEWRSWPRLRAASVLP